ncbi:MAG: transcriptional repressor [Verrucomicrobiota bacterium]
MEDDVSVRSDSEVTVLLEHLRVFGKRVGQRVTHSRQLIFRSAMEFTVPFTAEMLLNRVQRRDARIAASTVYRSIPFLVQSGLVREIEFDARRKFYHVWQASPLCQAKIICEGCGQEHPLEDVGPCGREVMLASQMGFSITSGELALRSKQCPKCQ